MKHVAKLTNLESLSLDFTEVTSSGLEFLEPLKKLKKSLPKKGHDGLDDIAAAGLSKLPELERIVGYWNVTDKGFEKLVKLKKVKDVSFRCHTTDKDLARIAKMESLERISISGGKMTSKGIAALDELNNLETLSIWSFQFKGDCFDGFKRLKKLVHLGVALEGPVTKANWESLGQMERLKSLSLEGGAEFDEHGLKALGQLKSLETLNVDQCDKSVDPGFLNAISKLQKLKDVSFRIGEIHDGDFACLMNMPSLTYMDFSGEITDSQLMEIAGHPTLSMFQNHSEKLTKAGINKFLKATPAMKDFMHPLAK